jgi:poly-gamma-glutamate capsule biosynthesis protein CapA/YwtB (metallophosphatase superfamily)
MTDIRQLIAISLLLIATQLCAAPSNLTGQVLSDNGSPLVNATVSINDSKVETDATGHYRVTVDAGELYQLRYEADGHFSMIHSYSALGLSWQTGDESEDGAVLPPVTLVERVDGRVLLAFGGDAMMGRRFSNPLEGEPVLIREQHRQADTQALLKHVKPYLQLADFASVNLESTIAASEPAAHAPKSFVFFSPPETLNALKTAGVDYVTLGNNHTFDYLDEGLSSTIDALNTSGLGWSGAGLTEDMALRAHRHALPGNSLSLLGFVGWSGNFNPNQTALGDTKGGAALGSSAHIRTTVTRERQLGHLPVVQYHGSIEYSDEPTLVTESRLKQAIDDGAVLAIGHHPHVVQGFELYNNQLIAYSLGNFIFDQFTYTAQSSFILYVWMDQGRFYRAEVMPMQIMGYIPTPATDTFRQSILKRVSELSQRRGVLMRASGGNAVIRADNQPGVDSAPEPFSVPDQLLNGNASIAALKHRHWREPVGLISADTDDKARFQLGRNLLPSGHFESQDLFSAPDRTWIANGQQQIVDDSGAAGNSVMKLVVPAGQQQAAIGMRTFDRSYEPGTPTSIVTRARSESTTIVTAYTQVRKSGQNRQQALDTAPLVLVGKQELAAGDWQELRFDFDSPRVSAMSYRFILQVSTPAADHDRSILFDDVALIEWLNTPVAAGPVQDYVSTVRASHIGMTTAQGE